MTLYRQVLLLLMLTTLVSLAVVTTLSLRSNSDYLQQQLRSGTDAAVTSLGMRVAPLLEPLDRASVETTVNAAFDGALLLQVDLELFADGSHIVRSREPIVQGVPAWFVSMFEIAPVISQAPITQGWREVALLKVEGHPGALHKQLWSLAIRLSITYGVLFLFLAGFAALALRWLIRPLHQIEQQANKIQQRDFDSRIPLPRTRELRRVVNVLNQLTALLKSRFSDHARQLDEMRNKLLLDADSGLRTRRAFLDAYTSFQEEGQPGVIMLLRADNADAIRKQCGFHPWREVINRLSQELRTQLGAREKGFAMTIGRLSSQDIAVLVDARVLNDPNDQLEQLSMSLSVLHPVEHPQLTLDCTLVASLFTPQQTAGQVLTQLDNELRSCVASTRRSSWLTDEAEAITQRTAEEWLALLRDRLTSKALQLRWQPLVSRGGAVLQQEVFASVQDENEQSIHAGVFIPVIEQFELGALLDEAVMKAVLSQRLDSPVSINLSLSSMRDTRFIGGLATLDHKQRNKIQFELSELSLKREYDTVISFANVLRKLGFVFGVDQVGASGLSLDYLQTLRPGYVKIAPGLCRADEDAMALLTGIANTVNNLDLPVYATSVETQEQADALWPAGIAGLQGYLTGR